MQIKPKAVIGAAVAVGALTAGGISLASAQEPNTTVPNSGPSGSTTTPDSSGNRDHNCHDRGSSTDSNDGTSPSTTSDVENSI
jgi:hypothetical protein